MPVSEYVEACLYHPADGFYMRGGRAGAAGGHFLTSPEVGPLFGAVLARALDSWWIELGCPKAFTVFDWGAGPGTLARTVLAASPQCASAGALRWIAVERSAAQREVHPVHPVVTGVSTAAEARRLAGASPTGVVIANELLDNLPFDIVKRTESGWSELRVTASTASTARIASTAGVADGMVPGSSHSVTTTAGCRRTPRDRPPASAGASAAAAGDAGRSPELELTAIPAQRELIDGLPELPVGSVVPVQHEAHRWLDVACSILAAGVVVVFDYGADVAELAARSLSDNRDGFGWLRTHHRHQAAGSWLAGPGECDITTDVAFDQLQAQRPADCVHSQADFLRTHGINELVSEGAQEWEKDAASGHLDALRYRSRLSEAKALVDPEGLGGFTVLEWTVT